MSFWRTFFIINLFLSLIVLCSIYLAYNYIQKGNYFYNILFDQSEFLRPKAYFTLEKPNYYDVIIIGGGTAGSVLANRLSDYNTSLRILVIEAGSIANGNIFSEIPGIAPLLWSNKYTQLSWDYHTLKQESMLNRTLKWPAGKALGGSSMINFMLYSKPIPSDFRHWSEYCPNWKWDSIHDYFVNIQFDSLTQIKNNHLGNLWQKAIREEKRVKISDKNTKIFVKRGLRFSMAKEHLYLASLRRNVFILGETQVEKLVINKNKVDEVIIQTNDGLFHSIKSNGKVVLSAGTIQNVRILSKTFPSDNQYQPKLLKDHLFVPIFFEVHDAELLGYSFDTLEGINYFLQYLFNNDGPLTNTIFNGGFAYLNTSSQTPNIQLMLGASLIDEISIDKIFSTFLDDISFNMYKSIFKEIKGKNKHGFSIFVILTKPHSTGFIKYSNNEFQIKPNYLSNSNDLKDLVDGIQIALDLIFKTKAFSKLKIQVLKPFYDDNDFLSRCEISAFKTQEESYWACYTKHTAYSLFHYFGTYPLGNSQVNCDLKLNDIHNLYMVDASVIPILSSGNMQATVMMIAEKFSKEIFQ